MFTLRVQRPNKSIFGFSWEILAPYKPEIERCAKSSKNVISVCPLQRVIRHIRHVSRCSCCTLDVRWKLSKYFCVFLWHASRVIKWLPEHWLQVIVLSNVSLSVIPANHRYVIRNCELYFTHACHLLRDICSLLQSSFLCGDELKWRSLCCAKIAQILHNCCTNRWAELSAVRRDKGSRHTSLLRMLQAGKSLTEAKKYYFATLSYVATSELENQNMSQTWDSQTKMIRQDLKFKLGKVVSLC